MSPTLALLIECKRSELPYVFFRSVTQTVLAEFPPVHGLYGETVELRDKKTFIMQAPIAQVLGLSSEPFATSGPVLSSTFSRANWKGKELDLSGVDPFNSIVLPLLSAVDHSFEYYKIKRNPQPTFFVPTLVIPICVLDAPMVVVDVLTNSFEMNPWVRIVRQETRRTSGARDVTHYAVDIVHKGFFDEYIQKWVLPLAETFRNRVEGRGKFFLNMSAHVQEFEKWTWSDVKDP